MNNSPAAATEGDSLTQAIASAWQRHAQAVGSNEYERTSLNPPPAPSAKMGL